MSNLFGKNSCILSLLLAFNIGAATLSHASENEECFDDVISKGQVTEKRTQLHAWSSLMDMMGNRSVSKAYKKLLSYGHPRLFVEILPPQNEGESKTIRYTFEAWRKTSFVGSELRATLVVDKYTVPDGRMDAPFPKHYRIGDVTVIEHEDL
jgi:hypothetical protein